MGRPAAFERRPTSEDTSERWTMVSSGCFLWPGALCKRVMAVIKTDLQLAKALDLPRDALELHRRPEK